MTDHDPRSEDSLPALRARLCDLAAEAFPGARRSTDRLWRHRDQPVAIAGAASARTFFLSGLGPEWISWQAKLPWPLRLGPWRDFGTGGPLPTDAVLIGARQKRTGALLSADAGAVIKLSTGRDAAMAARELDRLQDPRLTSTGLAPRVLASGGDADSAWAMQEFCTLDRTADAELLIRDVLPRMFNYWAAVGIESDSAGTLTDRVIAAVARLDLETTLAPALTRLRALAREAGDFAYPRVMTHGDLQPRHLMRGRDGRTVLIDWDTSRPRAFMADVQRLAPAAELFQPGDQPVRGPMAAAADAMVAWANTVGGEIRTPAQVNLLLLATLLERIVEIVEDRGIALEHQQRAIRSLAALGLSPAAVVSPASGS